MSRDTVDLADCPDMNEDSEALYDEHIAPLMTQIIALAKEHRIPMIASFHLGGDMMCTSAIPFKGQSDSLDRARRELFRRPDFMALTITTK